MKTGLRNETPAPTGRRKHGTRLAPRGGETRDTHKPHQEAQSPITALCSLRMFRVGLGGDDGLAARDSPRRSLANVPASPTCHESAESRVLSALSVLGDLVRTAPARRPTCRSSSTASAVGWQTQGGGVGQCEATHTVEIAGQLPATHRTLRFAFQLSTRGARSGRVHRVCNVLRRPLSRDASHHAFGRLFLRS
jgi:hypothetical protein